MNEAKKKPYRPPAVKTWDRCPFVADERQLYERVRGQRCLRDAHPEGGFHVFGPENVRVVCVPAEAARG